MALSVIDSGCIVFCREGAAVFAVKDRALSPLFGGGLCPGMGFHFEHIARDEFPSVCAVLSVDAGAAGRFSYDYFFMPDSPADAGALSLLCARGECEVWFSGGETVACFSVSFDREEAGKIERARALAAGG